MVFTLKLPPVLIVIAPERVVLVRRASNCEVVAFSPKAVPTLVVPISKASLTVKLFAVAVPVKAGLSKEAFKSKLVVVAFSPKAVPTLVVPTSKSPDTVKLTAVAVPDKAGLADGAFKFKADVVAFLPKRSPR